MQLEANSENVKLKSVDGTVLKWYSRLNGDHINSFFAYFSPTLSKPTPQFIETLIPQTSSTETDFYFVKHHF